MNTRRVVITGIGFVSSLGLTAEENWKSLQSGKRGIDIIKSFPCDSLPVKIAGEVRIFNHLTYKIKTKSLKLMNKTIQYAIASSHQAIQDSGLYKATYTPAAIGLSLGVEGVQYSIEECLLASYAAAGDDLSYYTLPAKDNTILPVKTNDPDLSTHPLWPLTVLPNMALCHISIMQQIQGPNFVFSSVDAAGAQAIGEAFKSIQHGEKNIYLAGGSYALNTTHLISLSSFNLLSQNNTNPLDACRPFDISRDGSVLGEGAAMLLLEELSHAEKRDAPIYAEIAGYGSLFNGKYEYCSKKTHSNDWEGMRLCINRALNDAGLSPNEIDYINADGKATLSGDLSEAKAIIETFGTSSTSIPVSTHKAATGHLLPASGAAEAAITALCIKKGSIPPTANCTEIDPQCNLNVIANSPVEREINCAISNTFGFTGEHTTLVLKKYTKK